jgi:predicted ATPase
MLWWLNMYHQFSGEMHSSLEISHQLMHLAEDLKDGALIMEARRALGAVLVLSGRCSEALEHLEKGAALYATHHDHSNKVFSGFDNKVMSECFAALALFPLGYPDQSAERLAAGLALARELAHPQTLVVALHIAAQLHHLRGEAPLVHVYAKEAMQLADEYGLAFWVIYGLIELGWAEAELGDEEGGIEKMKRGLAEYEVTGAKLRSQYFLGLLADQLSKAGRLEEGLAVITKALTLAEHTGEGFAVSELHRIKGELILKSADLARVNDLPSDPIANSNEFSRAVIQAQACFAEALAVTKQQQTRSWELKVHLSMDRLARRLGQPMHAQLADSYASFSEGFETADLKQARTRLDTGSTS